MSIIPFSKLNYGQDFTAESVEIQPVIANASVITRIGKKGSLTTSMHDNRDQTEPASDELSCSFANSTSY